MSLAEAPVREGAGPAGWLAAALNSGDLGAAAKLFTRDACFLTPDSTAVKGREEVRRLLAQLIAAGARIRVTGGSTMAAGGVMLSRETWEICTAAGESGKSYRQLSEAVLLWRRLEGEWKLAIAAPWGW